MVELPKDYDYLMVFGHQYNPYKIYKRNYGHLQVLWGPSCVEYNHVKLIPGDI